MSQSKDQITIDNSLDGLAEAVREITEQESITDQAHRIIREVHRSQVLAAAKRSHARTGKHLPNTLKRHLAEKYHFSSKQIEHIVYTNI